MLMIFIIILMFFSFRPFSGLQEELTGLLKSDGYFHIQCYWHERGEWQPSQVHLWVFSEKRIENTRGVGGHRATRFVWVSVCVRLSEPAPMLAKNHLIFHLSGSLWAVPPLHRPLQSKIPLVSVKTALAVPPTPPAHTKGHWKCINSKSMENTGKKAKRERTKKKSP